MSGNGDLAMSRWPRTCRFIWKHINNRPYPNTGSYWYPDQYNSNKLRGCRIECFMIRVYTLNSPSCTFPSVLLNTRANEDLTLKISEKMICFGKILHHQSDEPPSIRELMKSCIPYNSGLCHVSHTPTCINTPTPSYTRSHTTKTPITFEFGQINTLFYYRCRRPLPCFWYHFLLYRRM